VRDVTDPATTVDVAIVGGGPVGMLLAAELSQHDIAVLLVETRTDVDDRPRAGTVHARSLSHLARRGYVPSVPPAQIPDAAGSAHRTPFQFAGVAGLTISAPAVEPAPIAGIGQAALEAAFEQRAREQGADIRRGNTALSVTPSDDGTMVEVHASDGTTEYTVNARYCVGADGPRSLVAASGHFPSVETPATMNAISGLAHAGIDGPPPGWNSTSDGWTMHNPNPIGQGRVIGMDFRGPAPDRTTPTQAEYLTMMTQILGKNPDLTAISHLTRFSDYGRYRSQMRDGRLLVIGDAAHVHYPLGGQGLNTGMQDAFTLGWRLAEVLAGTAGQACLNNWSRRRVATAAVVVGNTVLQSRMMNPAMTDVRDAVQAMLTVPAIHDGFSDMISGQFQSGFVTDLAITDQTTHETTSLARLLRSGRTVELRTDDDAPRLNENDSNRISVTGQISPAPPWRAALIAPDGYLRDSRA